MTARVLLLTEDSAKDAHATLEALLRKLLQSVQRHDALRVRVDPPSAQAARGAHRNEWKARGKPHVTAMLRELATHIAQEDKFAVFHVDADATWTDGRRRVPQNLALFEHRVRQPLRLLLAGKNAAAIARLFVLHPHYSIEAWLYQNDREALRILAETPCSHGCRAKVEAWKAERALLDEVEKPKDTTPCLRDRHNLALTNGLPIDDVLAAEKSLHEARDHLAASTELCAALEA